MAERGGWATSAEKEEQDGEDAEAKEEDEMASLSDYWMAERGERERERLLFSFTFSRKGRQRP